MNIKWFILALGILETAVIGPIRYQFGIFFTSQSEQFKEDDSTIQLIAAACNWTQLISCASMGFLADQLGVHHVKLLSVLALSLSFIVGAYSHSISAFICLYHFSFFSVATSDITVTIAVKDQFDKDTMPILLSTIRAGSAVGNLFMSQTFANLLKIYRWDICLSCLGMIGSCVLVTEQFVLKNSYIFKPELKEEKNELLKSENEHEKSTTFSKNKDSENTTMTLQQEMTRHSILQVCLGMFLAHLSFMLIQDWTIKQFVFKGWTQDDGASILYALSTMSIFGRIGSGFLVPYLNIHQFQMFIQVFCALTFLAFAFVENQYLLLVFGGLYGMILGSASAQQGYLIRCIVHENMFNKATSVCFSIVSISFLVGGQLSSFIIKVFGYQYIQIIYAIIQLIAVFFIFLAQQSGVIERTIINSQNEKINIPNKDNLINNNENIKK